MADPPRNLADPPPILAPKSGRGVPKEAWAVPLGAASRQPRRASTCNDV